MGWFFFPDVTGHKENAVQTYTGRCLCGQSHFTVDVESLDVYACHCTICQKWSGGIAMYLEASGQPMTDPDAPEPAHFASSPRGERYFCSGCGCPLWIKLTDTERYFIPWTLLEFNEVDRRRLILAAEIYTETQPAFWRLTGQYARLSGKEVEELDNRCQFTH